MIPQLPPTPESAEQQQEIPVATVQFGVSPLPCQYEFSVTGGTDPEGKKVVFVALVMTTVNGSNLYWLPVEALPGFVNDAIGSANLAAQKAAANNPLIVANETQMTAALENMKLSNRNLLKPPGSS